MQSVRIYILGFLILLIASFGCSSRDFCYFGKVTATAYTSHRSQTDSSPWITASGSRCRYGVVACNFLPIGTRIRLEGFGNKVFVVEDRMHRRFSSRIDIWMASNHKAVKFGKKTIKYYVVEG
jgi:3D (Asp-Asp-Asp) domain-containing protein